MINKKLLRKNLAAKAKAASTTMGKKKKSGGGCVDCSCDDD
jgi:hypothetical protein